MVHLAGKAAMRTTSTRPVGQVALARVRLRVAGSRLRTSSPARTSAPRTSSRLRSRHAARPPSLPASAGERFLVPGSLERRRVCTAPPRASR